MTWFEKVSRKTRFCSPGDATVAGFFSLQSHLTKGLRVFFSSSNTVIIISNPRAVAVLGWSRGRSSPQFSPRPCHFCGDRNCSIPKVRQVAWCYYVWAYSNLIFCFGFWGLRPQIPIYTRVVASQWFETVVQMSLSSLMALNSSFKYHLGLRLNMLFSMCLV